MSQTIVVCPKCDTANDYHSQINTGGVFKCMKCKKLFKITVETCSIEEKEVQEALGLQKVFTIVKEIPVKATVEVRCQVIAPSIEDAIEKFNKADPAIVGEVGNHDAVFGTGAVDELYTTCTDLKKKIKRKVKFEDLPGATPRLLEDDAIEDLSDYSKKELKNMIQ